MKNKYHFIFIFCLFISNFSISQLFPNPVMLSTGQGTPGDPDPLWTCSPWYTAQPTDPSAATYTPALINNNCAPGSWVNPASLPAPVNNGNWITGQESNCSQNTSSGYRFFRLQLDLPNDCNGFSVTQPGNYSLSFVGYVDNKISEVYLNNSPLGISGGSFTPGSQISFTINGPWLVGTNYIDVLVYNTPAGNPNANNPYGLLLVADANSLNGNDTDGDGISDLFDECPCTPGNNSVGCADNSTCDIDSIRTAFTNAGCQELQGCWDECSMYFLNPQYLSGSAAQSFAQTLGANLISIQSAAENACILSDLNRLGYGSGDVIWIGFNDEAVENQFVWYDQSPVVYTNWAPGEPNNSGGNENCVQIYPGGSNPGTWNDLKCNGYNSLSVIEVNLCPVTSVTPPITMCQETDTTIKVLSTILGSSPYTYEWDNNSTQTSQSISPMQSTNYYITTKDRYSCSTNDTVFVTVNNLPTADFTSDAGCQENMTVNFNNSSTVQGNEALSSAWSFGNGQTSVDLNPQNVYVNYGGYTVTLIVSTAANCRDTVTHNISLFPKPTADFTYDANCSNNPTITFNNTSSSPDNGVLTYSWNLGGNQSSTDINPTVTLPNPTGNMVTLIVTSANNCKDTIIKSVDAKVQPVASFTANAACINETVSFSNTSVIANNTNITYNWNLGNGQTSTTKNPSTTYTTSGNQSVTLIATGENGCADTITKQVTVYVTPSLPVITSNAPIECPGDDFTFSGNAVNGASYFWSGPQAFTSTERENTITAETENQGDYSLFISVNGCKSDVATITMSISGNNNPTRYDFPNVITPNGDGVNDVLDMDAYFSSCLEYKIEIFNRWGLKVFEQSSGNAAFEGKDQKSGAILSEGTYFYKLTYGNEVVQGFLNIAR